MEKIYKLNVRYSLEGGGGFRLRDIILGAFRINR